MNKEKMKKAAGIGLSGAAVVTLIVTFLLKDMLAWPGEIDDKVNAHEVRITTVEGEVDHQKEIVTRIESDVRDDIKELNDDFDDMERVQETRHTELLDEIRRRNP